MDIFTVTEASKILDVTNYYVSLLCREGKFPNAEKRSGGWLIPKSDIKAYLQNEVESKESEIQAVRKKIDSLLDSI